MAVTCQDCLEINELLASIPEKNRFGKRLRFTYGSALIYIDRRSIEEGNEGHLGVKFQEVGERGRWQIGLLCNILANSKLGRA